MARPRNDKLKEAIRREAWHLFGTTGYHATSYTAMAEACGIKRPLVQYHFPKKEALAAQFLSNELKRTQEAWGFSDIDLSNSLDKIYAVGAAFYGSFCVPGGRSTFLCDILESRMLTDRVIPFNGSWIASHVAVASGGASNVAALCPPSDEIIVPFGGFHEALYVHLDGGEPYDVAEGLAPVVRAIAKQLGYPLTQLHQLNPEESFGTFNLSATLHRMQEESSASFSA